MRKRLDILARLSDWTKDSNPIKRLIAKAWRKLILKSQYRLSSSISISIIIHLLLFLSYLGMGALDQPTEPPIREITFIDMNEIREEPETLKIKKEQSSAHRNEIADLKEDEPKHSDTPQEQSSPRLALGKERLFLDTERKQAPINVKEYEPVAGNINQPKDILRVSPAIGIKKDKRTSKSAVLDLGKRSDMLMLSSVGPTQSVSLGSSSKHQIDLNPRKSAISTNPVSKNITASKTRQGKPEPEIKPKETQTMITGELANREILEKEIPRFPYWAITKGVGATVSLRFTVMENGLVKQNVIVERTSGSLQWDQMVISALKKWKFVPLKSAGIRQDQSGVITFQFVI